MSMPCSNADRNGGANAAAAGPAASPFDNLLDALEAPLAALGGALRERDVAALEQQVVALQAALAAALQRLRQPLRSDDRHRARPRLALAQARLAALRECVARESAAAARGLVLLMPPPQPAAVYGTPGQAERPLSSGSLHA